MFESEFKEARENAVAIEARPEVADQLITFLYEDEVNEDAVTWELYNLAKMYEVERLQQLCLRGLRKQLDVGNCCQMLEAAFLHGLDELFDFGIKFLKEKKELVSQTDGWKDMVKNNGLMVKLVLRGF